MSFANHNRPASGPVARPLGTPFASQSAAPGDLVDASIDLGASGNSGHGKGNSNNGSPANVVDDVTDIVSSLLKKPGKK